MHFGWRPPSSFGATIVIDMWRSLGVDPNSFTIQDPQVAGKVIEYVDSFDELGDDCEKTAVRKQLVEVTILCFG